MALQMKPGCEQCGARLFPDGEAFICSYECTFCHLCTGEMEATCKNCGGELILRPRRKVTR